MIVDLLTKETRTALQATRRELEEQAEAIQTALRGIEALLGDAAPPHKTRAKPSKPAASEPARKPRAAGGSLTDEEKREKQREYQRRYYEKRRKAAAGDGDRDEPEPATAADRKAVDRLKVKNENRKKMGLPALTADGFQTKG